MMKSTFLNQKKINSSGYRIYGEKEIDKLQQILFYKELGLDLNNINKILKDPSFDKLSALLSHKEKLLEHKERLDLLIKNIDKTILNIKGEYTMSNKEKFEGFKEKFINENEKNYGLEIRNKYGNDTINKSNSLFKNMS
ncbi:MerR family transcriptional regulator [Clostridium sp. Ade.TY]|uniref:MerR family transcriptional regulator n=1 Tax=Clostridium sp. Ade.TY TaxID=1391647 RepID=UPI00325AD423